MECWYQSCGMFSLILTDVWNWERTEQRTVWPYNLCTPHAAKIGAGRIVGTAVNIQNNHNEMRMCTLRSIVSLLSVVLHVHA